MKCNSGEVYVKVVTKYSPLVLLWLGLNPKVRRKHSLPGVRPRPYSPWMYRGAESVLMVNVAPFYMGPDTVTLPL